MKHTPGPWVVDGARIYGGRDGDKTGPLIATTAYLREAGTEIGNAHLIAAAPDLLAALEVAHHILAGFATGNLNTINYDHPALKNARAAIARAKGE